MNERDQEELDAINREIEDSYSQPAEEGEIIRAVMRAVRDCGQAAKSHLREGRSIVYREAETPKGCMVREYPSGRRDLIRIVEGETMEDWREEVAAELAPRDPSWWAE